MESAETAMSSWRLLPLSLQDSLGAGPGKDITVFRGANRVSILTVPAVGPGTEQVAGVGEAPSETRKEHEQVMGP